MARRAAALLLLAATFAEGSIVPAISAVPISRDVPPAAAALLGCAVATGVGAAWNVADVQPGDAVAVLGCGGVGRNVIQGARLAGAARILAIDRVASKQALAVAFGATDFVDARTTDPVEAVRE